MQMSEQEATFDRTGRVLTISDDQQRRRAIESIQALDAFAAMGDEEEQRDTFEALVVAIDEERLSDRRRFVG